MRATAVVITKGHLGDSDGKTAHGLIRGTARYEIKAVLDGQHAGKDAGVVLDGVKRNIPVFGDVEELKNKMSPLPQYAIIGVAPEGGLLPNDWKPMLAELLSLGISLVSGLHTPLDADPELKARAREAKAEIIDIRKPKALEALSFFNGDIFKIDTPRIAILGTDCAVGKRTTCRMVMELCRQAGIAAEMIYTGQTGWLQGYPYGFILDATPNDFVSGELERAIVRCALESTPDLILLEGQSALRNPFGPCGSELILSGNVKHIILQHVPFRSHFENVRRPECRIPTVQQEMELIRCFGAETIAVCLNGEGGTPQEVTAYQNELSAELGLTVVRPLEEGLAALLPLIRRIVASPK